MIEKLKSLLDDMYRKRDAYLSAGMDPPEDLRDSWENLLNNVADAAEECEERQLSIPNPERLTPAEQKIRADSLAFNREIRSLCERHLYEGFDVAGGARWPARH